MSQQGFLGIAGNISGNVVQIVEIQTGAAIAVTSVIPYDDTIPQQTEGDEIFTLAITPTKSTNKLIIQSVFTGTLVDTVGSGVMSAALFQDATANALAAVSGQLTPSVNTGTRNTTTLVHTMTAGTTSSTTLKIRIGVNESPAETFTLNGSSSTRRYGGVSASSLIITEVEV